MINAQAEDLLRSKLRTAADTAGTIEPLDVARLVGRRRRRTPSRIVLIVGVVALVAALAVVPRALRRSSGHGNTASRSESPLPRYTGSKVTVSDLKQYTWRAMPPAPIVGRYAEAAAWTGTSMIVWGGTTGNDELGDGAAYDPSSRTWTTLSKAPLSARVDPSGAWAGGAFVVWGGTAGQQPLTDGARYDPRTSEWTKLPPAPIASWGRQQLVAAGDHVVLLSTPPGQTASVIRADSYDPARNKWTSLPDHAVAANHDVGGLVALGVGAAVFVWSQWYHTTPETPVPGTGQITGTSTRYGVDAFRLDTESGRWSSAPVEPDAEVTAANPLWTGQRILLPQDFRYCGGCAGPELSDPRAVTIDPDSGARLVLPSSPVAGAGSSYTWTGGALLVVNGPATGGSKHLRPGDTAAYDPVSGRWTKLARKPATVSADEAVQFWTGDRLLVWGFDYGRKAAELPGAEFTRAGA